MAELALLVYNPGQFGANEPPTTAVSAEATRHPMAGSCPCWSQWTVVLAQHQIRVVQTENGARLYVDQECLDVTNDLFANGEEDATLAGTFGEDFLVEAFLQPSGASQPAIRVDGEFVTGDRTHGGVGLVGPGAMKLTEEIHSSWQEL